MVEAFDILDIVDLAMSPYMHAVLTAIAIALAYPIAGAARDQSVAYRRSRSPLWIAVPFVLLVALSPLGLSLPGVELLFGLVALAPAPVWPMIVAGLIIWQAVSSTQAIRARDEWPRTTVPFVVLLALWILPVAMADLGMIIGPMVKS